MSITSVVIDKCFSCQLFVIIEWYCQDVWYCNFYITTKIQLLPGGWGRRTEFQRLVFQHSPKPALVHIFCCSVTKAFHLSTEKFPPGGRNGFSARAALLLLNLPDILWCCLQMKYWVWYQNQFMSSSSGFHGEWIKLEEADIMPLFYQPHLQEISTFIL